jgi:SAM-dependent methyltransferase
VRVRRFIPAQRLKLIPNTCKTKDMGRFASTVEFYARYREPYPPTFFKNIAEQIALSGNESLLDIGCGPGLLAIGFAPFVGRCVGIDPEAAMIAAAMVSAAKAGVDLSLIHARIEEFSMAGAFDIVTIGRALHWLDRGTALPVLERITSNFARILICGASTVDTPASPWMKSYNDVRHSWAKDHEDKRDRLDGKMWFEGSSFRELETLSVTECSQVTIADLVGRALSKSYTSPEALGERRAVFEAQINAALEPFAQNGILQEQVVARASIFSRHAE